uniref:Uncharacterized protein n=1 Tax=Anopheles albimanus TaxID=7167 RepID=A0A182FWC5_ANOAL
MVKPQKLTEEPERGCCLRCCCGVIEPILCSCYKSLVEMVVKLFMFVFFLFAVYVILVYLFSGFKFKSSTQEETQSNGLLKIIASVF